MTSRTANGRRLARWLLPPLLVGGAAVVQSAASAQGSLSCHGQPATIVGTPGHDVYVDGKNIDLHSGEVIVGLGGPDRVYSEARNLTFCGGAGDDTVEILFGRGRGRTLLDGGRGDDELRGLVQYAEGGVHGPMRVIGGSGDDELIGGDGGSLVVGGPGDDKLAALGGRNGFSAGPGDDHVSGGILRDTIRGQAGDDYLQGYTSADKIRGGAGRDRMFGDARHPITPDSDFYIGPDVGDDLKGNGGRDMADGGAGAADRCEAEVKRLCEI